MRYGQLVTGETNRCIAPRAMRTTTMLERMRGLLGRAPLAGNEAFLIAPCSSVHTFGMRYDLDLIYLDRDWTIRKLVREMPPWRISACPGAAMVVELAGGRLRDLGLYIGESLRWEN